jgi:magnesium transporter
MLTNYRIGERGLEPFGGEDGVIAEGTAWVDLFQPTPEEEKTAEAFLKADLPTREEALEIEFSSRFYTEDGAVFMTASLLTGVDIGKPILAPLTIVVADAGLATLRYEEFRALRQFTARAVKPGSNCSSVPTAFVLMVESIVDRTADVIERISADVDRLYNEIFARSEVVKRERKLEVVIGDIGAQGDLAAKARESLSSLERLTQFAAATLPAGFDKGANRGRLKLIGRDIHSLETHLDFLSGKIDFLLEATLGLISVEQNEVIRVLTVVATFFFPPTLIATIYGMNFRIMPELAWTFGYPLAILAMLVSVLIPYIYFKRKGWM